METKGDKRVAGRVRATMAGEDASNSSTYGPVTIVWTPSTEAQAVYVEVELSNQVVQSQNLTAQAPNMPVNATQGNESVKGTISAQFSTGPDGNTNVLSGDFSWTSQTSGDGSFNGQIGTWTDS